MIGSDPERQKMNGVSTWAAYNDLAWTEDWLADPSDYEDEAWEYVSVIKKHPSRSLKTMLHLGSGVRGLDFNSGGIFP